jgi:hypothetical protein
MEKINLLIQKGEFDDEKNRFAIARFGRGFDRADGLRRKGWGNNTARDNGAASRAGDGL